MANHRSKTLAEHLRQTALWADGPEQTDGQLLGRFLERRDEAAFAALVRRYGPMVLGVCRRVLRGHHDAEDAFQATFLVLARKAASVMPRERVGHWLYGVARTTALRARVAAARRAARERPMAAPPEPAPPRPGLWVDLQPLLDEELSRLPARYRLPIVLCDLEGRTQKEAARQLGWPEGTVAGRLSRGRELLARRLARHGSPLSGPALAAALVEVAAVAMPPELVAVTLQVAPAAAGQSAAVSARVALLAEGVVHSMFLSKLWTTVGVVLIAGLLLGAAGLAFQAQAGPQSQQQQQQGPVDPARAAPPDAAQKEKPQPPGPNLEKQVKQAEARIAQLQADLSEVRKRLNALEAKGKPADPGKAGKERMAVSVYPVADLVGDEFGGNPEPAGKTLVRIITRSVEPDSWDGKGASIDYFPEGRCLVVRQTLDVHREVANLLMELRQNRPAEKAKA
jgi:RNA polymerase sigma factor (sigma-70 family)